MTDTTTTKKKIWAGKYEVHSGTGTWDVTSNDSFGWSAVRRDSDSLPLKDRGVGTTTLAMTIHLIERAESRNR